MSERSYSTHPRPLLKLPQHVAIIMDGNGRWAKNHYLPRSAGHRQGAEALRESVQSCLVHHIPVLTLFAFGKENWKRPAKEVRTLFRLFLLSLRREIQPLIKQNIRVKIIGDRTPLSPALCNAMAEVEQKTQHNTQLYLNIAINYSGRWDLLQAMHQLERHQLPLTEAALRPFLALNGLPEPDLLVRTGGVQRISNFFLWELAYTELYFTPLLWPDFDRVAFDAALQFFAQQERRFGLTSEQLESTDA